MKACRTRSRKPLDYAKLNAIGTTSEPLEKGKLADSPLRIILTDDEFDVDQISENTPLNSRLAVDDPETSLNYGDDLLSMRRDTECVVSICSSDNNGALKAGESNMPQDPVR